MKTSKYTRDWGQICHTGRGIGNSASLDLMQSEIMYCLEDMHFTYEVHIKDKSEH